MATRSGTKEKIQDVALELFSEQGYDKTSLREIAERLGVTKAALYYHFRTKEEIIASILEATGERFEQIAEWLSDKEPTLENRQELLRRYGAAVSDGGRHFKLIRLMQENQPALRELSPGVKGRERLEQFAAFLTDTDATLPDRMRARMSLMVMHMGAFSLQDVDATIEEKNAAALEVGIDLIARR